MTYSKSEALEKVLGKRDTNGMIIDFPFDYGYLCPKCGNKEMDWSEYESCVWCQTCNLDIPTCLVITELDKAIEIFIASVKKASK